MSSAVYYHAMNRLGWEEPNWQKHDLKHIQYPIWLQVVLYFLRKFNIFLTLKSKDSN